MKYNLILCLAVVFSDVLFGCASAVHHPMAAHPPIQTEAENKSWQKTLRDTLTNNEEGIPMGDLGVVFYAVPTRVAVILEQRPKDELLPYLSTLRKEAPEWQAGTVDEWGNIVRYGLRGTPETNSAILTNAKGVAIATNSISYYRYADHFMQRWDAATNRLQMSLAALKSDDDWGYPRFEVKFTNAGSDDLYLNLGFMLANGRVQLPSKIHLMLWDGGGRSRALDFDDKNYGAIGGRADDFAVPLRSGSSYTLTVRLDQFSSLATKEFDLKLKPGHYRVSAWYQGTGAEYFNTGSEGMALMNFWKGKIQSNTCSFTE